MRAYLPSYEKQFVVELHARSYRVYRRSHTVPREQALRRYDAGRARAEAREIVRDELGSYFQGLEAEAREQAAADVRMETMTGEEINWLMEQWDDDLWEVPWAR